MSDTGSIANFYVGTDGSERPIRYKASDLVNKCAPEGYVWRKGNRVMDGDVRTWTGEMSQFDYYIAVKKD